MFINKATLLSALVLLLLTNHATSKDTTFYIKYTKPRRKTNYFGTYNIAIRSFNIENGESGVKIGELIKITWEAVTGSDIGEVSLKIKYGYFRSYKIKTRDIPPPERVGAYHNHYHISLEGRFLKVLTRRLNKPLSSSIRIKNSEGMIIGKYRLQIIVTDHL